MIELTATQAKVFEYMVQFFHKNDQLPPNKKIAEHFNWSSANSAYVHINALFLKGVIEKNEVGKYRFTAEIKSVVA